jgi:putative FmdB family regulatory protein
VPIYAFRCEECEEHFDRVLSISRMEEPQDCPACGASPAKKLVTSPNFVLKGDDWAGKNIRIANQMRKKRDRLAGKENEIKRDAPSVRLAPNVDGQRVDSWAEASKLAQSKGKDTSGYDQRAVKEKKGIL